MLTLLLCSIFNGIYSFIPFDSKREHTHKKRLWKKIYSSWSTWIETITFWNCDLNSRWITSWVAWFCVCIFLMTLFSGSTHCSPATHLHLIFIDHKCRVFPPSLRISFLSRTQPTHNSTSFEWMNEYIWFHRMISKTCCHIFDVELCMKITDVKRDLLIYCHNIHCCTTKFTALLKSIIVKIEKKTKHLSFRFIFCFWFSIEMKISRIE